MPVDVLAIAAHRDDVELTCAGLLLKAAGQGYRIAILDRRSLEEIGHIGGPGRKAGEFFHLHSLDVDPQGNIVTGESQGYYGKYQGFELKAGSSE